MAQSIMEKMAHISSPRDLSNFRKMMMNNSELIDYIRKSAEACIEEEQLDFSVKFSIKENKKSVFEITYMISVDNATNRNLIELIHTCIIAEIWPHIKECNSLICGPDNDHTMSRNS